MTIRATANIPFTQYPWYEESTKDGLASFEFPPHWGGAHRPLAGDFKEQLIKKNNHSTQTFINGLTYICDSLLLFQL